MRLLASRTFNSNSDSVFYEYQIETSDVGIEIPEMRINPTYVIKTRDVGKKLVIIEYHNKEVPFAFLMPPKQ